MGPELRYLNPAQLFAVSSHSSSAMPRNSRARYRSHWDIACGCEAIFLISARRTPDAQVNTAAPRATVLPQGGMNGVPSPQTPSAQAHRASSRPENSQIAVTIVDRGKNTFHVNRIHKLRLQGFPARIQSPASSEKEPASPDTAIIFLLSHKYVFTYSVLSAANNDPS